MQILFHFYVPGNLHAAGNLQSFRVCYFLAKVGAHVHLHVCLGARSTREELLAFFGFEDLERLHITTYRRPFGPGAPDLLEKAWGAYFHTRRLITLLFTREKRRYDVFLARGNRIPGLHVLFRRLLGYRVVYEVHGLHTFHDAVEGDVEPSRFGPDLEGHAFRHADGVIAISQSLLELATRRWGKPRAATVIRSGAEAVPSAPLPEGRPLRNVFYVGNVYALSGITQALEAVAELPDATLTIVGNKGPGDANHDRLVRRMAELGISERVTLRGFVDPATLPEIYVDADIVVAPYIRTLRTAYFASPLKIFEYMQMQRPIVASDLPTIREVLTDGESALLVAPDDSQAIRHALHRLMSDPDLGRRLAQRAYEDAKQYTLERKCEAMMAFLSSTSAPRAEHRKLEREEQRAGRSPFRRILGNAGTLFSGNVGAHLVGLVATVIAGRSLGAETFGTLALIQTYVLSVDMLVNFQSWQALITFGAEALERNDREEFKALVKMTTLLDIATAIAGCALAIACAGLYSRLQGWDSHITRLAMLYSLVILVHLSGAPTAVLRLFDRFRLLAVQMIAISFIRVVGVLIAVAFDAGLTTFVGVWIAAEATGYLVLLALGWRELARQGYRGVLRAPTAEARRRHPGLLSFVISTNLSLSLRQGVREADTMVVGATLGDAAAGVYKIAKQFAGILGKVADPLYQAVFPELARLWSAGRIVAFRALIVKATVFTSAGSALALLGFMALGELFIRLTVGDEYVSGHGVMVAYMLGTVIAVAGFALSPAMLAMGRPRPGLVATFVSTIVYFPLLFWLIHIQGLIGAGLAYVAHYVVWTAIMGTLVARASRPPA